MSPELDQETAYSNMRFSAIPARYLARKNPPRDGEGQGANDENGTKNPYHHGTNSAGLDQDPVDWGFDDSFAAPVIPRYEDAPFTATTITTFTLLPDQYVTKPPLTVTTEFDYIADLINSTMRADKDATPWLKLARFSGIRNPDRKDGKGSYRYDDAVVAIMGVEGDYDAGQVSIDEAAAKIKAAGIDALLYETPSSTIEAPRWRVLCPTSSTYEGSPSELKATRDVLLGRVNYVLGGILDPGSFDLSRAFHFGNVAGKPPVQIRRINGEKIDRLDHLEETRPTRREVEKREATGNLDSVEYLREAVHFAKVMAPAIEGNYSDERTVAVANRMLDYVEPDKAEALLAELWLPRCDFIGDDGRDPHDWLHEKVQSASRTRQNAIGCGPPSAVPENWPELRTPEADPPAVEKEPITFIRGSSTQMENIQWLWPGWLPMGKLTLLAGAPEDGKSTLALKIAAIVSRGAEFPDGSRASPGSVLYYSTEDDFADTLLPRFVAAGGDDDKLITPGRVGNRAFDPATDIPLLTRAVAKHPDLKLIVLDPVIVVATARNAETNQIRRSLMVLTEFAAKHKIPVLGLTHFSKGSKEMDLLERLIGSQAYGAAARAVWVTVRSEDNGKRRVISVKGNLSKRGSGDAYDYEIADTPVPDHPDIASQGVVQFGGHHQGVARKLYEEIVGDESVSKLRQACDFILQLIPEVGDKIASAELDEALNQFGVVTATARRARKTLVEQGIIKPQQENRQWYIWHILPGAAVRTVDDPDADF